MTATLDPKEEKNTLKVGDSIKDPKTGFVYKVRSLGEVPKLTLTRIDQVKSSVTVKSSITIEGRRYKVTAIGSRAFCRIKKKIRSVTIDKGIVSIGKEAFKGCRKLKKIVVKTMKLRAKNVGKNAFKGIHARAKVKVPEKKLKAYTKLFKAKGMSGKKQKITK